MSLADRLTAPYDDDRAPSSAAPPSRPELRTDSVFRGSVALSVSRIVGMGSGFLLFLLLAWRSKEDVGLFRSALTYLTISEMLPLLGMHRWLATEMAAQAQRRSALFRLATAFAVAISAIITVTYVVIATTGVYSTAVSHALLLIATAVVGSGLTLCNNSALVGMGLTHRMGILTLIETLSRSLIGILLAVTGQSVMSIIGVFVVVRWIVALLGLYMVARLAEGTEREVTQPLKSAFFSQVPNLAVGAVCAIVLRYTAMVILPWIRNEGEAGVYAAPFQLFELLMLVPTMLIFSSNFVFCEAALRSRAALRQSTHQLLHLLSLYIFPLAATALVLAQSMVTFLFKSAFLDSTLPFQILMLTAPLATLDQVLSQAMVTAGHYRWDVVSTVAGAIAAIIATLGLSHLWGASGAAGAFLLATLTVIVVRLILLRGLISARVLLHYSYRPLLAAAIAAVAILPLDSLLHLPAAGRNPLWMLPACVSLALYALLLHRLGAVNPVRRKRLRQFLTRRS